MFKNQNIFARSIIVVSVLSISAALLSACASKEALQEDEERIAALMNQSQDQIDRCFKQINRNDRLDEVNEIKIRADHDTSGSFHNIRPIRLFSGSGPAYDCLQRMITEWQTEPPLARGPVDLYFYLKIDE